MSPWFSSHACGTRFDVFLDEFTESGPGVIATDDVCGLVLSRMSREDVVVLVTEYTESEVVCVRNVNEVIVTEETIRSNGPTELWVFEVSNIDWVVRESSEDVSIELFLIHDY